MKRTIVLIVVTATLLIAALTVGVSNYEVLNKRSRAHLGTWQLASYKYGINQSAFNDARKYQQSIKLFTENHFTWVHIDPITKKVFGAAGGTYTLDGNTYTESIDYGLGMDRYLGKTHTYTIKVEGDMFFLSGYLADSLKIEEIWQRVK